MLDEATKAKEQMQKAMSEALQVLAKVMKDGDGYCIKGKPEDYTMSSLVKDLRVQLAMAKEAVSKMLRALVESMKNAEQSSAELEEVKRASSVVSSAILEVTEELHEVRRNLEASKAEKISLSLSIDHLKSELEGKQLEMGKAKEQVVILSSKVSALSIALDTVKEDLADALISRDRIEDLCILSEAGIDGRSDDKQAQKMALKGRIPEEAIKKEGEESARVVEKRALTEVETGWEEAERSEGDPTLDWAKINSAQRNPSLEWAEIETSERDSSLEWAKKESAQRDPSPDGSKTETVRRNYALEWTETETSQRDPSLELAKTESSQKGPSLEWPKTEIAQGNSALEWTKTETSQRDPTLKWAEIETYQRDPSLDLTKIESVQRDPSLEWAKKETSQSDSPVKWAEMEASQGYSAFQWPKTETSQRGPTRKWAKSQAKKALLSQHEAQVPRDHVEARKEMNVLRWQALYVEKNLHAELVGRREEVEEIRSHLIALQREAHQIKDQVENFHLNARKSAAEADLALEELKLAIEALPTPSKTDASVEGKKKAEIEKSRPCKDQWRRYALSSSSSCSSLCLLEMKVDKEEEGLGESFVAPQQNCKRKKAILLRLGSFLGKKKSQHQILEEEREQRNATSR